MSRTTSRPSDVSRIESLDAARTAAWDDLRLIAAWGGDGIPGHEEGRRIVTAARRTVTPASWAFDAAMGVVDPTGKAFPVVIDLAWAARKANA